MTTRIEVAKLARVLGEDPARFDYLLPLPPEDVRVLRERATERLFSENRAAYERIAAASRLVPNAITAAIAQRTFGPLMCARVAGVLDADRALDLAGRLSVGFLADVAAQLDPRKAGPVMGRLPLETVVAVGRELVRRGDYLTMGRFVDDAPDHTLRAVVTALSEETLLRVALHSDTHDRFPALFALVADDRVPAFLAATTTPDLTEDVLPLLTHLDADGLDRLAAAADELSTVDRKRLRTAFARTGVALAPLSGALGG
ncbi:hypothetical protein [Actinokineospora pegani]|uniref:hypothetical protein n=1 Tax=Actinokineospora pegani TaxID=2654637 RepID=UPI0012E9BE49|nr:hypothetical protein [Actinokineospora pegani]